MVLLIDERPEEVTDFQRSVKAEVVGGRRTTWIWKRTCASRVL